MELRDILHKKPGYLKKGATFLANKFDVTEKEALKAKREVISRHTSRKDAKLKILILDIETAPLKSYVWGIWNQNINLKGIASEWYMLTWAAKWHNSDTIFAQRLTEKEAINENDRRISQIIWELLDEADIVVTHNGDKFDIKRLNTRFILNGLYKPSPYKSIDTLKIARKNFNFSSNKLDYLNKQLGIKRKVTNSGMEMWIKAINGDKEALEEMMEYNIGDIDALEELYIKFKPWIKNHPHITEEGNACPVCGNKNLKKVGKFGNALKYITYICNSCKSYSRDRRAVKTDIDKIGI